MEEKNEVDDEGGDQNEVFDNDDTKDDDQDIQPRHFRQMVFAFAGN